MANLLEQLLILQERDQQLNRLQREAQDIPLRKRTIESRLDAQRASLEKANEEWKTKTAALKNLETETEVCNSRIRKYRDDQFKIKSNLEYRALEHEITAEGEKIASIEDRELVLMEEVEAAKQRVMEIERGMAVDEKRVKEDQVALDQRARELEEEIAGVKASRTPLVVGIPLDILSRYERIFNHVKGQAVVPVENGACGGCHMNLPPQVVNDAKKLDDLSFCSYCGRIVYRKD